MNFDYIVVGSGAAGATAAHTLQKAGFKVAVIEEGRSYTKAEFRTDLFTAIKNSFRGFGNQMAKGRSFIPMLQGCCVGGSTVMNGAICHTLPIEVYEEWYKSWEGKKIASTLSLERIRSTEEDLVRQFRIAPTLPDLEKLPISNVFKKLGWEAAPMLRNAPDCKGSGNCLQGCQTGAKLSMEASFLPDFEKMGGALFKSHRAVRVAPGECWVVSEDTREKKRILAKKGILVTAGAIHTPILLKKSGYGHPQIGRNFQCHLSFGVLGRFSQPARELEGQPQGIEVFPPESEGIKLATQLLPAELLFARVPLDGKELTEALSNWRYYSSWTGSIRSNSKGSVGLTPFGVKIKYSPSLEDMRRVGAAVTMICRLFFEMGAQEVYPGVYNYPERLLPGSSLPPLPLDARSFFLGAAHLFGTCRIGPSPDEDPIDENFELRGLRGIYVLDASLFPSNIGVNPQLPIMALAKIGAEAIMERAM